MLRSIEDLPSVPTAIKSSSSSDLENSSPLPTWIITPPDDIDISKKLSLILENTEPEPVRRKSRRLHKELSGDDNELLGNFHDGAGVLARGTIIPIGLGHTPFQFNVKVTENIKREKDKLKIAMVPNFNNRSIVSKYGSQTAKSKFMLAKEEDAEIKIGDDHQAVIDDSFTEYNDEEEREELIWTPPSDSDIDHEVCRNEYYRSIWRQYDGHIPFETALQNLMKNGYDFGKSLETIDQCLKTLPQKMKPLAEVQFKKFEELLEDHVLTRRSLQEKCMRNYHISEVHNFYQNFKNHYLSIENLESCTCSDPLCKPLDFQPRWACPNCNKNLKPSTSSESLLCLICQTYSTLTGGKLLPATDVVFSDEDAQKILEWKNEEAKRGMEISKEDFGRIHEEAKIKRWMSNELTDEEWDIIDATKLPHRRRKNKTEEEKNEIGLKLVEQLQPHPLPLFKVCKLEEQLLQSLKLEDGDWQKPTSKENYPK